MTVRKSAASSIVTALVTALAMATPGAALLRPGGWRRGRHGRIGCKRILAIELVARQDTQQRDHDQRMGQGEGEIIDHGMVLPAALLMPRG